MSTNYKMALEEKISFWLMQEKFGFSFNYSSKCTYVLPNPYYIYIFQSNFPTHVHFTWIKTFQTAALSPFLSKLFRNKYFIPPLTVNHFSWKVNDVRPHIWSIKNQRDHKVKAMKVGIALYRTFVVTMLILAIYYCHEAILGWRESPVSISSKF